MVNKRHLGIRCSPSTRRRWEQCLHLHRACDHYAGTSADRLLQTMLDNHERVLRRRCQQAGIDPAAVLFAANPTRPRFTGIPDRPKPVVD